MFKDSAIILDEIQWLFLTKSATAEMFTSDQVNFGQTLLVIFHQLPLPS
jgi:hypothetical protein